MCAVPPSSAGLFGNVVAAPAGGRLRIVLPTGQPGNRRLMQGLCVNDDEMALALAPSQDIVVLVPAGTNLALFVAKIIRREGYFRAVLVQSRGVLRAGCPQRCGGGPGALPFVECRTVADFQGGACGSCVWQSRGARCGHHD
ncbi:hypothetical protein BU23DRAFT_625445 [Bimuria novae-zelandiae CBS 107.79]|uniref:Uncharacterized protein n=1 Tax=Bimuria novae-zelandiae CBS 107.79 TaxID=1447943 RepID=A0A6A5VTN7_9PLEO|nr:hypothetical protein BU23DRAFT_625445 [Bimuria novae-zelandiae CBS 107.79]